VPLTTYYQELRARQARDGGFVIRPGAESRANATAWAILALRLAGDGEGGIEKARRRLAAWQLDDGSVPVFPDHRKAIWPTPLAVLAWHGSEAHRSNQERAVKFLLEHSGDHPARKPDSPLGHNPELRGWPWILGTHSWVIPTSLAILALDLCGRSGSDRVAEAVKMLADRRLSRGGWNYGNTTVYGTELEPLPDTTGVALNALRNHVEADTVQSGIAYLSRRVEKIRTPISLGWGLLGLSAWGARPAGAALWAEETLGRQQSTGAFDTDQLALLLVAASTTGGLLSAVQEEVTSAVKA